MADCCEVGMNDGVMLDMMKQVQCEIGECHFDEEMADLHLCLIGQLHTKDAAKDYWHEVKNDNITINDWCVLWGEMVKRNDEKIKKNGFQKSTHTIMNIRFSMSAFLS